MKRLKLILAALGVISVGIPSYAATYTSRAGLPKPDIGSTGWGTVTNNNWDVVDSSFAVLGATNAFTQSVSFSNSISLRSAAAASFYTSNNTALSYIKNNGASGESKMDIISMDGIGVNNSPIAGVDFAIHHGNLTNFGNFAVVGSSQDTTAAYSGFQATSPITQSTLWSLPRADGTVGQALITDGAAHLSFGTVAGSGGASSLETFVGSVRSSPTASISANSSQFTGSVTGSTFTFTLNSSSVTLQGNTNVALLNSTQTFTGTNTFSSVTATVAMYSQTYGLTNATGLLQTVNGGMGIFNPTDSIVLNPTGAGDDVTITSSLLVQGFEGSTVTYALKVGSLTVGDLTSGQCVQAGTGGRLTVTGSACGAGGGGASPLQVALSGVQLTSPTVSLSFYNGDFGGLAVGSTSQIILNPATTNYIHNQTTPQTAMFNVSSGALTAANPILAFIESDQVSPAGKYRIQGNSDFLYVGARDATDANDIPLMTISRFDSSAGGTLTLSSSATARMVLRFGADSGHFIGFKASQTANSNTYVLPPSSGTAGQAILTDGANNLYFGTVAGELAGGSTSYIHNRSTLQTGATSYADYVNAGSSMTTLGPFRGFGTFDVGSNLTGASGTSRLNFDPSTNNPQLNIYANSNTASGSDINWINSSGITYANLSVVPSGGGISVTKNGGLSVSYGAVVGSLTVTGAGDGQLTLTIGNSTYTVVSATTPVPTVGNLAIWTSTNGTLGDGGVPGGGADNLGNHTATTRLTANFGISASTLTVSSNTVLNGTTFYANAPVRMGGGMTSASVLFINGGNSLASGSSNLMLGVASVMTGANLTTGNSNTCGGSLSCQNIWSDTNLTAFGTNAAKVSSGTSNISAFGSAALFSNTQGISNSGFGKNSGIRNTTGSRNSYFGDGACDNDTLVSSTTASGQICLGVGSYADRSNVMVIGGTGVGGSVAGSVTDIYANSRAQNTNTVGLPINFHAQASSGTNRAGGDFTISSGEGTGTGAGSKVIVKVSSTSNVTGTLENASVAIASFSFTNGMTVLNNAHFNVTGSTQPTLTACGSTPSVIGTDTAFTITGGTGSNGCVATFAKAFTNVPTCVISQQSMSLVNAITYTVSATALTITQTGLGTSNLDVACFGHD